MLNSAESDSLLEKRWNDYGHTNGFFANHRCCRFVSVSVTRRVVFRAALQVEVPPVMDPKNDRNSRGPGMCPTQEIHIPCNDLLRLGTKTLHPSRLWLVRVSTVWLDRQ